MGHRSDSKIRLGAVDGKTSNVQLTQDVDQRVHLQDHIKGLAAYHMQSRSPAAIRSPKVVLIP